MLFMKKIKRVYENFIWVLDRMGIKEIAAIAAATAFWFFLSLVPIVILAVSVLPYTPLTEAQLLHYLSFIIPDSMMELITVIVADVYRGSLAILSVSIIATLWSSAKGFSSMLRGLEEIYRQERRPSFLARRVMGVAYTLGMIVFILLLIVMGGFGSKLRGLAERFFPVLHEVFDFLLNFRFVVVLTALTVFFTMIYVRGSGKRLPIPEVLPGAVFTALGWSFLTWAFSAWVSANRFNTYGSLATVVVVMLWLYWCQYILLLGACLNRSIPEGRSHLKRRREEKQNKQQSLE